MNSKRGTRRFVLALGAIAASVLLLILGWSFLSPKRLIIRDPAFHLTFYAITSGTNHTIFSGDELLARLNQKLTASRIRPLTDDRMYKLRSVGQGTLLSIGYRYDGASQEPDDLFTAAIVQPGGTTIPLRKKVATTVVPAPGEHLCMWLIPGEVTNLAACDLHLSKRDKNVATIKLQ